MWHNLKRKHDKMIKWRIQYVTRKDLMAKA